MIELLKPYRGILTNENLLAAGTHSLDAELEAYLVENGYAVPVKVDHYAIGVDFAEPEQDSTIETLVALSHDEPVTVAEVSSDNPDVQVSVSNVTVSTPATVPTVKPSKLHKPQSKR